MIVQIEADTLDLPRGNGQPLSVSGTGIARYTSSGTVVWGRDLRQVPGLTNDLDTFSAIDLTPDSDLVVAYRKWDPPPTGPVQRQAHLAMARVIGNQAALLWETTHEGLSTIPDRGVARAEGTGMLAHHSYPYGLWRQALDGNAPIQDLQENYAKQVVADPDGSTLWYWSTESSDAAALNPWSDETWVLPPNPGYLVIPDAFIVGVNETETIGPWFTEGDSGPRMTLAVDKEGDLLVTVRSNVYVAFNGGQLLVDGAGIVLTKIDGTSGQIQWRTPLEDRLPASAAILPGNRIGILSHQNASSGGVDYNAPLAFAIHSTETGELLTAFDPGPNPQLLAAGVANLYVLGFTETEADFDPGSADDLHGDPQGVYISRYSF